MTDKQLITVICSTNRPDSKSSLIANYVTDEIKKSAIGVNYLSMENLPSNFMNSEMYGQRSIEMESILQNNIENANAFLIIVPDYNGGFPGVFKTFIDSFSPSILKHKKVAMIGVSSGQAGAMRGMDQLTNVFHYLKCEVYHTKPKLSGIESLLNQDGWVKEDTKTQIDSFCKEIISWIS